MRAIVVTAFGSAEHCRQAEVPLPEPQPGEVRIRSCAAAFNPTDYQRRQGQGAGRAGTLPLILGIDAAGVVDTVGTGVTAFAEGDEVYTCLLGGGKTGGAYAEYVCRSVDFVAHKPRTLSFSQAAAVVTTGIMAYQCLEQVPLSPGQAHALLEAGHVQGKLVMHVPLS
jgi:NADPH:quinone reductase-like Zn-dependent oxidoreductase